MAIGVLRRRYRCFRQSRKERLAAGYKAVAETYGKKTGGISYIFCSDEKILEVNRQYLQHDSTTRISHHPFDYTEGNKISGDLFHQPRYGQDKCGDFPHGLQRGATPHHHPRRPASLRYQRQRPRRAGDHGGKREQSVSDLAGGMSVKRC